MSAAVLAVRPEDCVPRVQLVKSDAVVAGKFGAPVAGELRKVERVFDVSITTIVMPWSYVFTDLEDRLLRSLLWTKSNLVRTI